jgi:hypothetical protein
MDHKIPPLTASNPPGYQLFVDTDPVLCPAILFSDLTIREHGTSKLSIIGTFTQFNAPSFPFLAPQFFVTLFLTNIQGPVDGLPVTLRVEAQGSGHVLASTSGMIPIPATHSREDVAQIVFAIPPTVYPAPGQYRVHVLVRNEQVANQALFVRPITGTTTTGQI